ncbi:hypothetical protein [Acinetobacter bereziniae]|uniref:hypothetical protein n=1 Tax=Acinetobacter bereziniae TaxID=106648 RepID=UPI0030086AEA
MKFRIVIFQILIVIILIALIFTSFSWILIHYQNPTDSVKEALTISVSFMGVLGTIFAAFIALLVFKGWRITEDHKTKNGHINNAVNTYLQLQDYLKLKTIPLRNTQVILQSQTINLPTRIHLMLDLNEIQIEILHNLRALQTHIQLFATIANNLTLCGNFERVINEVQIQAKNRLDSLLIDLEHHPQSQILISYDDYFKYITGQLITDLHLKIIIEITKESKALN